MEQFKFILWALLILATVTRESLQSHNHEILEVLDDFVDAYKDEFREVGKKFMKKIGFYRETYGGDVCCCPEDKNFDFVVIGSGTAGAVVASRLSENPSFRVLLLEAGGAPHVINNVPSTAPLWSSTDLSWGSYLNCKQDNAGLGMKDEQFEYRKGKGLGGSTLLGYMYADRGSPCDYDTLGVEGWNFKDFKNYFVKLENYKCDSLAGQRGKDGPVSIETIDNPTLGAQSFVEAASNSGYKYEHRNNNETGTVFHIERLTRRGLRETVEKAYLRPTIGRKNLVILQHSLLKKIVFEGSPAHATKVKYHDLVNDRECVINVGKEVIVAGGNFGAAQALMVSGIGPKENLQNHGIEVVKDLPVGRTLYEQLLFGGLVYQTEPEEEDSVGIDIDSLYSSDGMCELVKNGTGPLTHAPGLEATALYWSPLVSDTKYTDPPDMSINYASVAFSSETKLFREAFGLNKKTYKECFGEYEDEENIITLSPVLLRPSSVGYFELSSADPTKPLTIYGKFLTNKTDVEKLIAGIREAQRIVKNEAFQKLNPKLLNTVPSACDKIKFDTDEYWACAIKYLTVNLDNNVGSCKAGLETDATAVVGPDFKVHGVGGIRVVGGSVIPEPLSAYSDLPVIMLAEYASDLIKKSWVQ